jgi:predicted ArsR family transcriptional regulator
MAGIKDRLGDTPYVPPSGYPARPGWKEDATSREAAEAIEPRTRTLRKAAYSFIRNHPGRTADEIANALGESPLAIRPRISELRRKGLIVNAGRGHNKSGKAAHRWIAA